jgi:thiamine biosynthesis lipoprotein
MSRLNRAPAGEPFSCSPDLFDFLCAGAALSREASGAFDLTVGPLVRLYDLRGSGRWPMEGELDRAMQAVGSGRLRLDPSDRRAIPASPGMTIDPGGLGKGYALDAAARVLRARGFPVALFDFGGQVLALDAPPGKPGWPVALSHPRRRHEAVLTLVLAGASLATSGNVEHGLVVDGRALGHIMDPVSGRPAPFQGSASIVAPTGARADAFSTALFVMGPERGLAWAAGREGLTPIFLEEGHRGSLTVRAGAGLDQLRAGSARPEPRRSAGGF